MSAQRLTARDYKRARRGSWSFDLAQARVFAIGLAIGLVVAGVVYVADHRGGPEVAVDDQRDGLRKPGGADAADSATAGSHAAGGTGSAAAPAASDPAGDTRYDFYQMLPKFEVVVPEKERGSLPAPAAQIDKPGIYFLQAGSYRDPAVAERIRAQLAKLGIDATVQRVAVDNDVWHRVRIGPIRDLKKLNQLRSQLRASDLDALVIRVDD